MQLDSFISFSTKTNEAHCEYDHKRSGSIKKVGNFPSSQANFN